MGYSKTSKVITEKWALTIASISRYMNRFSSKYRNVNSKYKQNTLEDVSFYRLD